MKKLSIPAPVSLVIFFGSRAKGTARSDSDADVAYVAHRELTSAEWFKLAEYISAYLYISEDSLDLVDISRASPLLTRQVAETGTLIFGDKEEFLRFRVLEWKRYVDTARFRTAREKALAKKLEYTLRP